MYFIGDTHGKIEKLLRIVGTLPKDAEVFQLGDMGLGFRGVFLPHLKHFKFIRGNHDSPKQCQAHPNYAGEYGYDYDTGIFWIGGAWSIDAMYRTEDVSWWRDEELSTFQLEDALKLYSEVKPHIVVSHEAPSEAAKALLNAAIIANPGGEQGYFGAKFGCVKTRTSETLQKMFNAHKPDKWIFGHYHFDKTFELDGCEFTCLAELSVKEVKLCSSVANVVNGQPEVQS
jgi:hypothetical protein